MPSQNTPHPEKQEKRNPALSKIVERNIRTIIQLRIKAARDRSFEERFAGAVTSFSGSMAFITLHIGWVVAWIVLNSGHFRIHPFDPFPYGLLATIVSIEAVLLSTLVLITQKRLSDQVERRANLDLHIGLLTEHELTRALRMLHAIQEKLEIETHAAEELADLEMETKPEDVLAAIARLHRSALRDEMRRSAAADKA
jgi:uncharacterized membrane protein